MGGVVVVEVVSVGAPPSLEFVEEVRVPCSCAVEKLRSKFDLSCLFILMGLRFSEAGQTTMSRSGLVTEV